MYFSPKNQHTKITKKGEKKYFFLFFVLASFILINFFLSSRVNAAPGINQQINFQGKVVNKTAGTNITNGDYTFVFRLYDVSTGGTHIWTDTETLTVTDGIFQYNLGSDTGNAPLPGSVDFNTDNIYLGINFNSDGEMLPRVRFTAAPYAMNAKTVGGLSVTNTTGSLTVANAEAISFGGSFTTTGTNDVTLTTSGATNVTLPTTGTLATLAGSEEFTNKTIGSTGLTFSGAATDITTATDEALTFTANGTGDYIFNVDSGTFVSLTGGADGTGALTIAAGDLTLTDGDLVVTAGDANFTLDIGDTLNIVKTGASAGDVTSIAASSVNAMDLLDIAGTATTDSGADIVNGINLAWTESADADVWTALNIANTTSTNSTTQGLVIGTGYDTGISVASGGVSITAGALAVNSDSITSDGTLVINAAGTVDVDDILNANSITSDAGVSIATGNAYTGAGAVTLSSGGSSGLTLDSASGRVGVATGDFLSVIVSGVTGAAAGDIWYDSAASKFKINEGGATKILCNTTDNGCGTGGGGDLQTSYGLDANGSDATISLTADDDSIIFTNPSSSGTESAFLLRLSQANTTASVVALDIVQSSNAANGMNLVANSLTTGTALSVTSASSPTGVASVSNGVTFNVTQSAGTNATTYTGVDLLFTNNPTVAGNTEYALRIQNQATSNATDNTVAALLLLDNADTTGTGTTVVTDAIRITDSGGADFTNFLQTDTIDIAATGTITGATWNGTAIGAAYGGTGISTASSTGIPTISSGTWSVSSSLGVTSGGTGTTTQFTAGSIVFAGASGVYTQDNANFFWDDSTNRLGIGTASPAAQLSILGTSNALRLSYDASNYASFATASNGNLNITSSNTAESQIVIGNGSSVDSSVAFDGASQDYYSGVDHTTGSYMIGGGFVVGSSAYLTIASSGNVQIGTGGSGSTTPKILGLDVKSDTGDPTGFEGAIYYNTFDNVFRCYQTSAWTNCIGAGGATAWDAIGDTTTNGAISMGTTEQTMDWEFTTTAHDGLIFNFDNNGGTAGADNGIVINNAVSTNSSGDVDTENLFLLQQLDTTASGTTDVDNFIKIDVAANGGATDGIEITNSGGNLANGINVVDTAGGTFATGLLMSGTITTGIDLTDTNIGTGISLGANDIVGTTGIINYTGFDVDASGNLDALGTLTAGSSNIAVTDSTGHVQHDSIVDCTDGQILKWATGGGEWGCAADSTGSGPTSKYLNTQHNISSTTATEVTGISTTLTAGTYVFKYSLIAQAAATGTGISVGINYTGTVTKMVALEYFMDSLTAASGGTIDDANIGLASEQIVAGSAARTETTAAPNMNVIQGFTTANVDNYITIEGVMVVSDGGDIELWHASESAAQTSIMTGSTLVITQITQGADLAEIYGTKDESMGPGDVVSLDPSLRAGVKKSEKPYDKNAFGIVSTSPGIVTGSLVDQEAMPIIVALAGRVPVKVTTENGPIRVGDLLTSSSIPGVAMRATKAGQVVGQAMRGYDGEGIGRVLAFIKTDYSNGSRLVDILPGLTAESAEASLADIGDRALAQFISQKEQLVTSINLSEIVTDRLAAGLEIITPKVTTQELAADIITPSLTNTLAIQIGANGAVTFGESGKTPTTTIDALGNATFAGVVTAKTIRADTIEGLEIYTDSVKNLAEKYANLEAFTNQGTVETGASSENSPALVASPVSVLKDLMTNTLVVSFDASVLGELTVTGGLSVTGDTEFQGETLFQKLATFFNDTVFKGKVAFEKAPTFSSDTAGFATITEGSETVHVIFGTPYEKQPIVTVTISNDQSLLLNENADETLKADIAAVEKDYIGTVFANDVRYLVTEKSVAGFTIVLNKKAPYDLQFSWVALAVNDAKTSYSEETAVVSDTLDNEVSEVTVPGKESAVIEEEGVPTIPQVDASGVVIQATDQGEDSFSGIGDVSSTNASNTSLDTAPSQ